MAISDAYGGLDDHRLQAKHLERVVVTASGSPGPHHPETIHSMRILADAYTWE